MNFIEKYQTGFGPVLNNTRLVMAPFCHCKLKCPLAMYNFFKRLAVGTPLGCILSLFVSSHLNVELEC